MPACRTRRSPPRRAWPPAPWAPHSPEPGGGWSKPTKQEVRESMSHADDGTLHGYLDGQLAPVERAQVEAHLASCPACRTRLDEERALIERADALLGLATPPERT